MRMTPAVLITWSLVIIFAIVGLVVVLPSYTIEGTPSEIYRPRTPLEDKGRKVYITFGCTYCHSQYIRTIDSDLGAERIAQVGDYVGDRPHLLGSERTGPDLSQEGGEHTDDWHVAHFHNPRYTRPESIMPPFPFLADPERDALIAYVQSLGGKDADGRMGRQREWHQKLVKAYEEGPDANIAFLHEMVPAPWRELPNPYPATEAALKRGERIYLGFCIGCHGAVGDGRGPAAPFIYPPPLNFTTLKRTGVSGGILYYQIMNGITGSAMPYFKRELESEKIWDVSNYVAKYFVGILDANQEPRGIDASYEPVGKE